MRRAGAGHLCLGRCRQACIVGGIKFSGPPWEPGTMAPVARRGPGIRRGVITFVRVLCGTHVNVFDYRGGPTPCWGGGVRKRAVSVSDHLSSTGKSPCSQTICPGIWAQRR